MARLKVWTWRQIIRDYGPDNASYKLVLFTLSTYMGPDCGSCYPSIDKLCSSSSLGKTTVVKYLKKADEDGWIIRNERGTGQGWRRKEYTGTLPKKVVHEVNNVKKGGSTDGEGGSTDGEGGSSDNEGGSSDVGNVVQQVNSTTPGTTPEDNTSERAYARDNLEKIYNAYPRDISKKSALVEIEKALAEISKRETVDDPFTWLLEKVQDFAESPAGNDGEFTPHPDNWFQKQRYNDDSEEWYKNGQTENNLVIYSEMVDMVANGPYNGDDFIVREDILDDDGNPMLELKK